MTRIVEVFGINLRSERNKKGLTQEELAERCEISVNHLASIEAGRRYPSAPLFQRIADILKVEPYRFLVNPKSTEAEEEGVMLEEIASTFKVKIDEWVRQMAKGKRGPG